MVIFGEKNYTSNNTLYRSDTSGKQSISCLSVDIYFLYYFFYYILEYRHVIKKNIDKSEEIWEEYETLNKTKKIRLN